MVGDTLWVAIQRPWKDDGKTMTKLLAYNTKTQQWSAVHYPLENAEQGWSVYRKSLPITIDCMS